MKLYYHPDACSLASQIALRELGRPFECEDVDLVSKLTKSGADFTAINPKGYVPALQLDNGELLTENLAVLDYIASESPALGLKGPLGRSRLLESLSYIATELEKSFEPFFTNRGWTDKAEAKFNIVTRMQYLADRMKGIYLLGDHPTVADFYLLVTLRWADKFAIDLPAKLVVLRENLESRPAVQEALRAEALI